MKHYPVVTVTLNPAVDKSTAVAAMVPEKKLQCAVPVLAPGGGGINVARAIKRLGGEAIALYLSGGYNGELLKQLLDAEGVDGLPIPIKNGSRENLVVVDNATNLQYRFGMPGPWVAPAEWQECLRLLEATDCPQYIVASGSLSPGIPPGIFAQMADITRKKNARFIVDTSGEALEATLREGVFLIKPSLSELTALTGKAELIPGAVIDAAKEIIARGQCEVMVLSMGAGGAMLIAKDIVQHIPAPAVNRKSTIGAGDSMVAGIILSLLQGKNLTEAAEYGVACGTAATMNPGTTLCVAEDVEKIYRIIHPG